MQGEGAEDGEEGEERGRATRMHTSVFSNPPSVEVDE